MTEGKKQNLNEANRMDVPTSLLLEERMCVHSGWVQVFEQEVMLLSQPLL